MSVVTLTWNVDFLEATALRLLRERAGERLWHVLDL